MARRAAFTLLELLIVVAVIAALAGLGLAAAGMVRTHALTVRCLDQLRQLGMAVTAYESANADQPPPRLRALFAPGGPLEPGDARILVCPADASRGHGGLNRTPPSWGALDELWRPEEPCSYLYECSEQPLDQAMIDYFYVDLVQRGEPPPAPGPTTTWAAGKRHYLRWGNVLDPDSGQRGAPFAASGYPLARCFWHRRWRDDDPGTERAVLNAAWDGSVFSSIPKWEHQANPLIPLGERFVGGGP